MPGWPRFSLSWLGPTQDLLFLSLHTIESLLLWHLFLCSSYNLFNSSHDEDKNVGRKRQYRGNHCAQCCNTREQHVRLSPSGSKVSSTAYLKHPERMTNPSRPTGKWQCICTNHSTTPPRDCTNHRPLVGQEGDTKFLTPGKRPQTQSNIIKRFIYYYFFSEFTRSPSIFM